jgi:type I restriction enzyme M protein
LQEHGLPLDVIFTRRNEHYYDFVPTLLERGNIKTMVETCYFVQAQEARLRDAFEVWWSEHQHHLRLLPHTRQLTDLRAEFLTTFDLALEPVGLLDSYKIAGIIARWWYDNLYDLKTLIADISSNASLSTPHPARSFPGLIESKIASAISELQDEENGNEKNNKRNSVLNNKFIMRLLPDYLRELAETETRIDDLQQQREAFERGEFAGNGEEDVDNDENNHNYVKELENRLKEIRASLKDQKRKQQGTKRRRKNSTASAQTQTLSLFEDKEVIDPHQAEREILQQEITTLEAKLQPYWEIKSALSELQKFLRILKQTLIQRIENAHAALTPQQCEDIVLTIAHDDLLFQLEKYLSNHRRQVIAAIEHWWDKYRFTVQDIRSQRAFAEQKLEQVLKELGYA